MITVCSFLLQARQEMIQVMDVDTKRLLLGLGLIFGAAPFVGFLGSLLMFEIGAVGFYMVLAVGTLLYLMPWISRRPVRRLKPVLFISILAGIAFICLGLASPQGIYSSMIYGWSILAGCIVGTTGCWIAMDY